MGLYSRILGHPFVYNKIRPLMIGGIDFSRAYESVNADNNDVVLDLGCGTGDALNYITKFSKYVGVDVDPIAIRHATQRFKGDSRVSFECRQFSEPDMQSLSPSLIILGGLLHHVNDEEVLRLFKMILLSPNLSRVLTFDTVILKGDLICNILTKLDRGKFGRTPEHYQSLAARSGMRIKKTAVFKYNPTGLGIGKYFVMVLSPTSKNDI